MSDESTKKDRRPYWRAYAKERYALKKNKMRQPVDIPVGPALRANLTDRPVSKIEKWKEQMLKTLRVRAEKQCTPFDLTHEDLKVSVNCPVFDVPFNFDNPSLKPSVDRIDSSIGYHRDNICVMSVRANLLKSDATLDELICLGKWAARTRTQIADKQRVAHQHRFGYRPKYA